MSSLIFQPLLHDPIGWKPTVSTYSDHYKWRKFRTASKDKKASAYGQKYQRQLRKQQQKQANRSLPLTLHEEQTHDSVAIEKKNNDNQERPASHQSSSSKQIVYVVENKQRPASTNENTASSQAKVPQRSSSALPIIEAEKTRPVTAPTEFQQPPREEKTKVKASVDANNDNSRHWLTYPNPRTPQYIIDIKERLGQLKVSSTLSRPSSASTTSAQQQQEPSAPANPPQTANRPLSASTQVQQKQTKKDDDHNFIAYRVTDTPDELRVIRHRIDKHRYNPSLDNCPQRPKTCPVRVHETPKPGTPKEPDNVPLPSIPTKTEAWVVDEEKTTVAPEYESPSILIQMVDCDGLPNEYVEALETANVAQEEYLRSLQINPERRPDNIVYCLPAKSPESRSDSLVAYENRQQTNGMNSQLRQLARSSQNDFGNWVRNATDQERASAMKILKEVLNQPIMGYDSPTKSKPIFKQAPAPPPVRTTSATRKLGRTRTQHQFPCEICEKLLIKRHVWDLSGSETVTCPHRPQGIQVRA